MKKGTITLKRLNKLVEDLDKVPSSESLRYLYPDILFEIDRRQQWIADRKGIDIGKRTSGVPILTKFAFRNKDPLK